MGELSRLSNVGPVLEKNLNQIGVYTETELKQMGCMEAFIRIRQVDPGACLHMLYGLQGAILGIKDSLLPQEIKQDLKAFYKTL